MENKFLIWTEGDQELVIHTRNVTNGSEIAPLDSPKQSMLLWNILEYCISENIKILVFGSTVEQLNINIFENGLRHRVELDL